ncbi:ankyrin repeat domain-containing protein [Myxosarcina sp. GI1]|uniref:ankyrin repeat domain-containing protein n=1 Tax=Myxosarcina sp. GI1 TaxID=1541065 RepID=UPI00055B3B5C|nr:ankyrin repeat domain-containing protein [Myxosarcina sp. GI1]
MSAFIWLWVLSSSLCSIITAVIARNAFGTGSSQLIQIAFVVYWISLGLVQWKVLNPYISNAYIWGLVTIVGGIISSFLLVAGWAVALGFFLRNVSFPFGSSNSSSGNFLISSILAILFLFGSGFLLGWLQKLALQSSISSVNINYIAWITGFTWLLAAPLLGIVYFSLARYHPFSYILLVTIFAIFANLVQGSVIRQILSSNGLISEDILSRKMIAYILIVLIIAFSFAYPIRYRILEAIGFTEVLHGAVIDGKINAQKYLDGGGNPNGLDKYQNSLLHSATRKENLPLIELLIARGADINIRDKDRETSLHKAKSRETAELLLANGAKVNAQSKNGNTPLHYIRTLDLEVVEVLLKYGADPNIAGFGGKTPLYSVRNCKQAKILLENGANPNVQNKEKNTPLHTIFRVEQIETSEKLKIAEVLIHYGADVNAKDNRGKTPLNYSNKKEIDELLIENGARY